MGRVKIEAYVLFALLLSLFLNINRVICEENTDDPVEVETIPYESPPLRKEGVYFSEHFDDKTQFDKKWVKSESKKPDISEDIAKYDGEWDLFPLERFPLKNDKGLVLMSGSRHSAISAKFDKPFRFDKENPLIIQYVVAFQHNHDCGGAYLKLLTEGALTNLKNFNDKTPYTIMFGPDKCGNTAKMHFIIRHKNPKNGEIVEKHCTKLKGDDVMYTDHEPTLLKLILKPDNNFQFFINNNLQYEGNLLASDVFEPPIIPPKEITDPSDKKPDDWDDRPKIPDPDAAKPDDWDEDEPPEVVDENAAIPDGWLEDESTMIQDETAVKPDDWDEEMDGEWEPPLMENPKCKDAPGCGPWTAPNKVNEKYKGKWKPPMIDNPDYKGKWTPKKISNPDYFYDEKPFRSSPINAIGFELWSLVDKIYFDDILVTDDEDYAEEWSEKTWVLKKRSIASESVTWKGRLLKLLNFKPEWWLAYAIYCFVPIAMYFIYMNNILKKTSWYKQFLYYTNEYPWLWAVYVLILAVVVGFVGMFFFRSKKNKEDFDRTALHKKTDEDGEVGDETEQQFDLSAGTVVTPHDQDQEDNDDEDEEQQLNKLPELPGEPEWDSDEEEGTKSESDEVGSLSDEASSSEPAANAGQRRRKPRKEN